MYTWEKVPDEERETKIYEDTHDDSQVIDDLTLLEQYEILDPEGDQIAIVYSEGDAEALVTHLNR